MTFEGIMSEDSKKNNEYFGGDSTVVSAGSVHTSKYIQYLWLYALITYYYQGDEDEEI